MFKELVRHRVAYGILVVTLLLFAFLFLAAWPNRERQQLLAVGLGVFYFCWGSITHLKSNHFTIHIAAEYLAVAALATSLIALVTW